MFFQRVIFEVETQPGRLTRADSRDGADVHAAMSSYVWLRDCGGSTAAQMKLGPGPAEDSLEIIFGESFFAVFKGAIHEIAVEVGRCRDVKRCFFAAFDFDGGDFGGAQGRDQVFEAQVLHGEGRSLADGFSGRVFADESLAADIGAFAAVSGTSAQCG